LNGGITSSNFVLAGGTLMGNNATNDGVMSWTGGSLGAGSALTIASNAVLNISGSNTLALYGVLTNAGTVNWSGTGNLEVYNGAYGYTGGIVNLAGAVFNVQNDQTVANPYSEGYFDNAGLLQKSPTTGATAIDVAFNNTGTVDVESGTVAFDGGGAANGTFTGAGSSSVAAGKYSVSAFANG
jgi:hypothetical protein